MFKYKTDYTYNSFIEKDVIIYKGDRRMDLKICTRRFVYLNLNMTQIVCKSTSRLYISNSFIEKSFRIYSDINCHNLTYYNTVRLLTGDYVEFIGLLAHKLDTFSKHHLDKATRHTLLHGLKP